MCNDDTLTSLVRSAFGAELSPAAAGRMSLALNNELAETTEQAHVRPVMTLHEVAAYLRVTEDVILEMLGNIPCFELGGRLLFRKDGVDEWIRRREQQFAHDQAEFTASQDLKLCL